MSAKRPNGAPASAEQRIDRLAEKQHGVVTRRQLLEAGVAAGKVQRRLESGRLRRLHRGVYQVGPVAAPFAREMAAVLACGARAAVSHRSAGALRGLTHHSAAADPIEVTVPLGSVHRRPGIRLHRRTALPSDEVTRLHGIRVTSAARTVLDLAGVEPPSEVERVLAEALVQRMTNRKELLRLLERHPHHRGARELRALLDEGGEAGLVRSEAEKAFHALMERAGLPKPHGNRHVAGRRRDFVWPAERVVVEVDGYQAHTAPGRFENDRRRDAELFAAGYAYLRITWKRIQAEPEKVIAAIAQALVRSEQVSGSRELRESAARAAEPVR